jgi:hypothetical protein
LTIRCDGEFFNVSPFRSARCNCTVRRQSAATRDYFVSAGGGVWPHKSTVRRGRRFPRSRKSLYPSGYLEGLRKTTRNFSHNNRSLVRLLNTASLQQRTGFITTGPPRSSRSSSFRVVQIIRRLTCKVLPTSSDYINDGFQNYVTSKWRLQ